MLFANSSAIITDAFPADQRGLGLGINNVAAIAGSFIGLVLGGLLAPVQWHLVFLVSVPFGIFGTVWAYVKLEDRGVRTPAKIDWWGNVTFAAGLILILVGITYGLLPYGGHTMGWTSPSVHGRDLRRHRRADRLRRSSRRGWPIRCSASPSSASAPSRRATWPASWPR